MSYVAIARKWRPKLFSEIAGQKHITKTLENAIKLDRVHHAYLFSGPRGVGKTTAARILARSINCIEGPTINPCGVCTSCKELLSGTNTDVIEIDGASNNSVEDIRELRKTVQYSPVHGKKKIYIIDEVHMLSKGAFNALLKTLEEPPSHVLFMFATTEPQNIPDTILSRVQRFEFKRIPLSIVVGRLQKICDAENIEVEHGGLQMIARSGEGSMRDSQSLLDQVISFSGQKITAQMVSDSLGLVDRQLLYQTLEGIVTNQPEMCLSAVQQVYDRGYDLSEFSTELLELLRNATMVVLSEKSQKFLDIAEDEKETLMRLAPATSPDVFVRSFQIMLNTHEQIARSHRPKLVLEMAIARLTSIRPAKPIDELIAKLNKMGAGKKNSSVTKAPPPKPKTTPQKPTLVASKQPTRELPRTSPVKEQEARQPVKPPPKATAEEPKPLSKEVFLQYCKRVHDLGIDFEIWANDCAVGTVSPPVITFLFPSKYKLNNAQNYKNAPELREVIAHFWPDCPQIKLKQRTDAQNGTAFETNRERLQRLRDEKRRQLQVDFESDQDMQLFCKLFQATIKSVHLVDEDLHYDK